MGGVIKMVSALGAGVLPRTLHVEVPSRLVEWEGSGLALLREEVVWPDLGRPRRAGVSSFGISGTNAHVILEQAPPEPPNPTPNPTASRPGEDADPAAVPLVLSAKTPTALRAQAAALHEVLAGTEPPGLRDIGYTLARRSRFDRRAVVRAATRDDALAALAALRDGAGHARLTVGRARTGQRLAVLFSGQGGQRVGMGVELLRTSPAYAEAFDEVAARLDPLLGTGLRRLVADEPGPLALGGTGLAQPALFALETALYRLAESHGLRPDFLIGHSVGEITAAHVAGVLDLDDACALVAVRARLMQSAPPGGGMAALAATEARAAELAAAEAPGAVVVAAVNGPASVVLSGEADALDRIVAGWKAEGRKATRLRVSHAFHSAWMDPVLEEFRAEVSGLAFHPPQLPIVSTVTGTVADAGEMSDPEYWVQQIRRPVRFADAVRSAAELGVTRFAEAGPDGSLAALVPQDGGPDRPVAVALLRPGRPEAETVGAALAELHAAGVPLDLGAKQGGGRLVDLPAYPFETRRYWLRSADGPGPAAPARPDAYGLDASAHPLLPASVELPDGGRLFTGVLATDRQPWLAGHRLDGRILLPAAALAELALAAGRAVGREELRELLLSAPLELQDEAGTAVQLSVDGDGGLAVRSRGADGEWTTHATGLLVPAGDPPTAGPTQPDREPGHGAESWTRLDPDGADDAYARLAEAGYGYGPAFQGLSSAMESQAAPRAGAEFRAEAELPEALRPDAVRYGLHPALLDAALHVLPLGGLGGPRLVPYTLQGVRLHATGATRVRARLSRVDPDGYRVELTDRDGRPVLTVDRLRLRPLPSGAGLHRLDWRPVPEPEPADGSAAELLRVEGLHEDPYRAAEFALAAIHSRLAGEAEPQLPLVFVTDAGPGADPHDQPGTAALWGLVRAAQAEHPGRFALVHAGPGTEDARLAAVGARGPQAVVRGSEVLVPHPVPVPDADADADADGGPALWPRSAAGGTVLITGGTGAAGRETARHLAARHGVRSLLLVGRRGADHPDADAIRSELAALGATADIRSCDVADRDALAALLADLPAPLTGVIHAAGVAEDTVVERLDPPSLRRTLDAKARAADHLDLLTRDTELDAFVLYGSVAGVLGTAGQAAYCAANAALEGVARRRRRAGSGATAVHWGLWQLDTGLSATLADRDRARLARSGIRPMAPADALALLDRALRSPAGATGTLLAADLRRSGRDRPRPALPVSGAADDAAAAGPPRDPAGVVLDAVADILGYDRESPLDPEQNFSDLGFDSLTAVELRNRLNADLGLRLPGTVAFDHPNAAALIRFVAEQAGQPAEGPARTTPGHPAPATGAASEDADLIAIVGMACRFPGGVGNPAEFWELLAAGADAVTGFPEDRGWDPDLFHPDPEHRGTSSTRFGGFLHDAAEFDPAFFGISRREALAVDPQQRLLLETAWEAAEDAGIDPATLRGSDSGVFVGVMYADYGARLHQRRGAAEDLEGYLVSGSAGSVASGRIAYTLGLQGPAVTVDTACSSSLVALHQAAQALRLGECSLALAGGATVMASPATFVEFSRQQGLAADGRCKPFSAAADGTAWGEGVGLLVLERLADARRHGHRVLATVRGSAVNQDGASNGLTAPNGPAQERVIRRALSSAGLGPADVDVLQAHGTGTRLGDPIEAGAVLRTYGSARTQDDPPLLMGSVKSNIGHTQAAAGVAGIIAMVQAMRHGEVPGTLHLDRPSEHVDWSSGAVAVPTVRTPWPDRRRPRRAAVSSFGISGTNAHVILEQGDLPPERAVETRTGPGAAPGRAVAWALSARTAEALREQAARLRRHAAGASGSDADIALSLGTTRSAFEHRAVVVGRNRAELLDGLGLLADGGRAEPGRFPILATGTSVRGDTAVLFTGQGSQRVGMGAALHAAFPVYARAFDEVCTRFHEAEGLDVAALVADGGGDLDRTGNAQAALFAVEVALFRLLESWGLSARLLAGHSVGEIAAAHVAGALSLDQAAALVGVRGRLMQELPSGGAMAAVQADPGTVTDLIAETGLPVEVAAVNTPGSVVLSGPDAAVTTLAGLLAERGHRTRRLTVSHAFHSALMEPMLVPFHRAVSELGLAPGELTATVVSTRTGLEAGAELLGSAGHWTGQVRATVRFNDAVERLRALGATRFLEVGPDTVLTALLDQSDLGPDVRAAATLDRRQDDLAALWSFVARAHVAGVAWDWRALAGEGATTVPLPTYAFDRERLWLLPPSAEPGGGAAGIGAEQPDHPLLAAVIADPDGGRTVYTGVLSHHRQPWLADHALHGVAVLPATSLVELLGRLAQEHGQASVAELVLHAPLAVPPDTEVRLRITVAGAAVRVHGSTVSSGAPGGWTLHAEAQFADADADGSARPPWAGECPADAEPVDLTGAYDALAGLGYGYGPAFRGLRALWRSGPVLHAELDTGGSLPAALLDAALHAWPAAGLTDPAAGTALSGTARSGIDVPVSWHGVRLHRLPTGGPLRARIEPLGDAAFALDVADASGRPVLTADQVRLRPLAASGLGGSGSGRLHEVVWEAVRLDDLPAADGGGETVVAVDRGGLRENLGEVRRLLLGLPDPGHLVVVTTDAAAVLGPDRLTGLDQAALWGLVRTARLEHPGRISIVDTDGSDESAAVLARAAGARPGELALRRGRAYRPRLRPVAAAPAAAGPAAADRFGAGTVLVTGAGGALGSAVARHLVDAHGVRRLLLVSRRGDADPALRALAGELAGRAEVATAACDLADPEAVDRLFAGIAPEHRLTGVFHAAGVVDDAVLANLTEDRLDRVLRPKADAGWNLHRAVAGLPLAAFVLFSSVAGVIGSAGQGAYASANAYLDALARHRRAAGLPGTSLAWGLWEAGPGVGGGMAAGLAAASRARIERLGIRALSVPDGLDLLDRALALGPDRDLLVPLRLDPAALAGPGDGVPDLLADLVAARRTPVAGVAGTVPTSPAGETVPLARRLSGLDPERLGEAVAAVVRGAVADVLALAPGESVPEERGLFDVGLDSLTAIELRNRLGAELGERLPATVLFDFPTVRALSAHLADRCAAAGPAFDQAALGAWVAAAARLEPGQRQRTELVRGLRAALGVLTGAAGRDEDPVPAVGEDPAFGMDSASDDELFGLLDRELSD